MSEKRCITVDRSENWDKFHEGKHRCKLWPLVSPNFSVGKKVEGGLHCNNSSVTCTPNLLHRHTIMEVYIEQIWCAGHTTVFTV